MINVALFGNPNVGKTTVFNLLTGSNQYVGNWPGVTIDKKEGFLGKDIKIVDLPGIYAMDTFSNEEKVSKEFLETGDVDVIVNIVDASNLSRNLYLTTQLMEFNKPIVILLNMLDVAESKGIYIDSDNLSKELGVTVVPIIAKKKNGVDKISLAITNSVKEAGLWENIAPPIILTINAPIQARTNWYISDVNIILFPYSFLIVASAAIHGVYNALNTKKPYAVTPVNTVGKTLSKLP